MENDIIKKEIIEFVMNFDKVTAVKMPPQKQVKFIAEHLETFKRDILFERQIHSTFGDMLTTLFRTSYRIWNLYRPDFLATIPYEHQALLAEIGSNYHETSAIYGLILNSHDILPPESRALFCASRMNGWQWPREKRFFAAEYNLMCLRNQDNGIASPGYPTTFCRHDFYQKYPSSFAEKVPQTIRDAVESDNCAQFGIALSLCNRQLSKNVLLYVLANHATNILAANLSSLKRYLPLDSLILYCASSIDVPAAIPLMTAIERNEPSTIRNAKDIFGNNALWYTFYRTTNLNFYQSISAKEDFESISRFLLDNGVSPDEANCLDLTYSSMRKAQMALSKIAD